MVKHLSPQHPPSQLRSNKATFCLQVSACIVNKCPLCGLFSTIFFTFLFFLLVILLFKTAPEHNAGVLFNVPEHKKAMICLMEKMSMLEKLHSGLSYSDLGCEFSVNKLTIYIYSQYIYIYIQ